MSEGDLGGFGDARLRRLGATLLSALQETPTMCVHALARDRNQALQFGRFLDNDAVSADEMLVHAGQLTGQRAASRHVLAIQDTTELHFAGHAASKRGFGLAGNGRDLGLFMHPISGVDAANGGVIGLVGAQVINRTAGRAADAKESHRWLSGAQTAAAVLEQAEMITVVADRESDIYDQFARRPDTVHLLTRAAQDRALADGTRLFAQTAAWTEQDRHQIALPKHAAQPGRVASVALRFGQVAVRRPRTADQGLAETVTLHGVDVAEISPPAGQPAVHWCLLTTHPVHSVAQARQILGWYQARWTIEQVFRTRKSAAVQAETSQIIEAKRFTKLAVAGLIAAVRIMQIVLGRDGSTGQSLTDAADRPTNPCCTPSTPRWKAEPPC